MTYRMGIPRMELLRTGCHSMKTFPLSSSRVFMMVGDTSGTVKQKSIDSYIIDSSTEGHELLL